MLSASRFLFVRQLQRAGSNIAQILIALSTITAGLASAQGIPSGATVGYIYTYAGGTQGQSATQFDSTRGMTFDSSGNLYACDLGNFDVKKVTPQGVVSVYVANVPCTSLAFDQFGNLYVVETYGQVAIVSQSLSISILTHTTGLVSAGTVATASVGLPSGLAFDAAGDLYLSTTAGNAQNGGYILKITAANGVITSNSSLSIVAGIAQGGYNGDGIAATQASLYLPYGLAVDSSGNIYIADQGNLRVRKILASSGLITTVAGNGVLGHTNGSVGPVSDVKWDATTGNLYVADFGENVVYKITTTGATSIYAGTAEGAETPSNPNPTYYNYYTTDGIAATSAPLSFPEGMAIDGLGNVYIGDSYAWRMRVVIAPPLSNCNVAGNICTIAGNGMATFAGDQGLATAASLYNPLGLYLDSSNNIFVADSYNNRVRKFTKGGNINTIAGDGNGGNAVHDSGDGGSALQATTNTPGAVTEDGSGNLFVLDEWANGNVFPVANSDTYSNVRMISASGNISSPYTAFPNDPNDYLGMFMTDLAYGTYLSSNGVRSSGLYLPFYGSSGLSFFAAPPSQLSYNVVSGYRPTSIALDATGNLYFSTAPLPIFQSYPYGSGQYSVFEVSPNGSIMHIAGNGSSSYSGDGGLASSAGITPGSLAVDSEGNIFVVDLSANVVRVIISPSNPNYLYSGYIFTVAGSPTLAAGFSGDGGPATAAQLNSPGGIKLDASGNLYISDSLNNRVRLVSNPANVPGSPIGQLAYSGGDGGGDGGGGGVCPCTNVVKAPKRPLQ